MSRIYTRSGDNGETGLFGGQRVSKDDLRVEAYGTVDELNALLGIVRTYISDAEMNGLLQHIQNDLFSVGSDLATPAEKDTRKGSIHIQRVAPSQTAFLEAQIDHYEAGLPPLTYFILPGGSAGASALHHARTVCRRAERRAITLSRAAIDAPPESDSGVLKNRVGVPLNDTDAASVNPEVIRYLNRLSDLLFVLARAANQQAGVADVRWMVNEVES